MGTPIVKLFAFAAVLAFAAPARAQQASTQTDSISSQPGALEKAVAPGSKPEAPAPTAISVASGTIGPVPVEPPAKPLAAPGLKPKPKPKKKPAPAASVSASTATSVSVSSATP